MNTYENSANRQPEMNSQGKRKGIKSSQESGKVLGKIYGRSILGGTSRER